MNLLSLFNIEQKNFISKIYIQIDFFGVSFMYMEIHSVSSERLYDVIKNKNYKSFSITKKFPKKSLNLTTKII